MELTPTARDRLYWARELARCERDFVYTCEKYLRIKSKDVIGFPTLRFNRVQRKLYDIAQEQLRRDGRIRLVIGKSRQIGSSTFWSAWLFHQVAFRPHRNAILVAHDEPSSIEIFSITKGYYDALPKPLQPAKSYDAKQRLVFPGRNSKFIATHAANTNVAAGQMMHLVHVTEAARFGPNAEAVQASLFPTISEARGADYSMVIIESTSVFGGDWFKQFWEASRDGATGFQAVFIPWFEHDAYVAPVPRGFEPTPEERDLAARYRLTRRQLAWRRLKLAEYQSNPLLWEQEYPSSWESSWQLPKGTLRVFSDDVLERLRGGLRPPLFRAWPTSSGLDRVLDGPVEVWQEPEPNVFYDIGIDVAEGASEKADWSVLCVVRRDTLEQVAEARLHMNPASRDFIDLVYWLGHAYHTAQLCPDITGGWGNALLVELRSRGYGNVWRWRRRDDARDRVSTREGFLYTRRDKAHLVSNAIALAQRGTVVIHSETLWSELTHYLNVGLDQWAAAPGAHDDCVNAWMLALLAARDERLPDLAPEAPPAKPTSREIADAILREVAVHDVDADLAVAPKPLLALEPWS